MKKDWTYKKLGEVAEISAGQGAPQGEDNYCDNGTPFIKAGNLEDLINGLSEMGVQKVSENVAKTHRLKKYKAGSVLFAKSGMSCMKGWVYTLKTDCYVVSHLAIITPFDIESSFLNYYLQFNKPNNLVQDAAYPSISLKDIQNLRIPIPEMQEQQRIDAELDLLCDVIEKQKAQIEELDKLSQSIFYDMFGDPVTNEKGWEVGTIGSLCSDKKNIIRANKLFKKEDLINYIDISSINNKTKVVESLTPYMFKDAPSRAQQVVTKGDILISTVRPNLKNIAIVNVEGDNVVSSSGFCVLRAVNGDKNFLMQVLNSQSFTDYLVKLVTGANYPAVKEEDIKFCKIGVPPLSLQQEFAAKIEAIEVMKAKVRQSLIESETLFNSRMDYYFN